MTWAKQRNAWVRELLAQRMPGVAFRVAGSRAGAPCRVSWVDGPTNEQVFASMRDVPQMERWPYLPRPTIATKRRHSPELLTVAMLRARRAGKEYYSESDSRGEPIAAGDIRPDLDVLSRWATSHYGLDARTITDEERMVASLVLEASAQFGSVYPDEEDPTNLRIIGRTLFHLGDALEVAAL